MQIKRTIEDDIKKHYQLYPKNTLNGMDERKKDILKSHNLEKMFMPRCKQRGGLSLKQVIKYFFQRDAEIVIGRY